MRGILIGLVLVLVALPAWAQSRDGNIARCQSHDPNVEIAGCTALIQSGQETTANLVVAYNRRGMAYVINSQNDQAIVDFTKVISLKPDFAEAYNNRAFAYHQKGDDANALRDAEKAVTLVPDDADFIVMRGEIYAKLGQRDKAIADYRVALKIDPTNDDAKQGLKGLGVTP